MRESFGSVFLYNIIIIFLLITFAFLSGTLSYMKAFKANTFIVSALEKFEGYNELSNTEINNRLGTMGYRRGNINCPTKQGTVAVSKIDNSFRYCIYKFESGNKDYYGVLTNLYFEFPIIGTFSVPLYTKTEKIYRFNS